VGVHRALGDACGARGVRDHRDVFAPDGDQRGNAAGELRDEFAEVTEREGTERFRAALAAHAATAELTPDFPFPQQYSGVYLERRRECGLQLYESVGIAKGDRAESAKQAAKNFELFGAPHAAIVTTEAELGVYGAIDCGLYVQTFLLAAQSLGLGAIPQAALAAYAPFIREFFNLPDNRLIVCGMSFGWPDHDHPANGFRTRRATVDDTVTWAN
jgi:nitroreductase